MEKNDEIHAPTSNLLSSPDTVRRNARVSVCTYDQCTAPVKKDEARSPCGSSTGVRSRSRPVVPVPFPRSSPRTPPYDLVLFLCARPMACAPFSPPSTLRSCALPAFASPPPPLFLPCAFPAHDIVLPLTSRPPVRFLPRPVSPLPPLLLRFASSSLAPLPRFLCPSYTCSCVASPPSLLPALPILSPRVLVPPPRIHTLLIPDPRPSRFFPHFVLRCFLTAQSPPFLPAPLLPCPHPSASPRFPLSPRALPLPPPLPPSHFLPHSLSSPHSPLRAPLRLVLSYSAPASSPPAPPSPFPLLRVSPQP
ncbi:hypothetical protein DFH09DRAFT_1458360 [Mycena vulgaris]|nr:hypothetical protein DFH09DRAFT_1458360 [Mycena vulgaris]